MSLLTLMQEIGDDSDLLVRSDMWLEMERKAKATELDRTANELRAILLAQKIKCALQQKNLVAVQEILREESSGEVRDIVTKIVSLPEALTTITQPHDTLDEINAAAQLMMWDSDGYDIRNSAKLRKTKLSKSG